MQVFFTLYCSVMSDSEFSENNIVFPRTQKSRGITICSSENKFIQTETLYFFYYYFFLWRWRGGGGFIINIFIFIFIFIFFYGGASHITGGGCGGLIFFKRSGLFFIFIFFYGGGRTSLGEGGVGKIKCPRRGPIFFCFFFFAGGGGVVAEKIWGGVEGKAKGRKKPRGQITCDDVVRKV